METFTSITENNFNLIYYTLLNIVYGEPEHLTVNRKGDKLSEIINSSFTLTDPRACFAFCRKFSMDYLKGELEFYFRGSPLLSEIQKYSKFWEGVSDNGKTVNSNYGKLLLFDRNAHGNTQFEHAKESLLNNKESKKAVMTIYDKENAYISNDNPCTMYVQFFIRNNKLLMFVKMRSSDIWYGLPYDVPFFSLIHQRMYNSLVMAKYHSLEFGYYNHQAGSLHVYDRNSEAISSIIRDIELCKMYGETDWERKEQIELFLDLLRRSYTWKLD